MASRRAEEENTGVGVLIVGAGRAGQELVGVLRLENELRPVAYLDDGAPAHVKGLRVLGGTEEIVDVAGRLGVTEVLIALPSLPTSRIVALIDSAISAGLRVRYLPSGSADVADLRQVNLGELLGRPEIAVAGPRAWRFATGLRVMVTGAGGAIGTHLCRHLRRHAPAALYQVDNDARRLRRLEREGGTAAGEGVVADVTDPAEVERVMAWLRPDIVFHAAGASAGTPPQLVMANVCGTMNLAAAAVRARTPRFVLVSSDHAADPESALGATQRLAELAVQSLFGASGAAQPTVFSIARLGHVIDADGSLLSMVAAQAIAAVPVTLSHPDATSFLMTTREAVGLILQAASMAESAETFVFDSGRATPAVELVRRYAAQLHLPEVTIRFAAVEGGRRRYAKLLSDAETRVPTAYPFIAATRAARLPSGVGELLRALCETAAGHQAEGAGDAVRSMMQRILPEYRPREATR